VGEKHYGIADKAWQPVVGCDPHMPCAPRCWARKTVARIVECQKPTSPERAALFQIALTPDGKQWSGKTFLDEAHLADPLKWRKPALIATGFHGDIGRLPEEALDRVFAVVERADQHSYLMLTKCPRDLARYLDDGIGFRRRVCGTDCACWGAAPGEVRVCHIECECECHDEFEPFSNVSIGCSVMNQSEADKMRPAMAALAAMGWRTHVWYEPALGPVDWTGWEFLELIISGGESGTKSRPSHPQWHRDTRDFCQAHGMAYRFKQWGDWTPREIINVTREHALALPDGTIQRCKGWSEAAAAPRERRLERVGKRETGRLLDGREWSEMPEGRA
jgi:protein gp37